MHSLTTGAGAASCRSPIYQCQPITEGVLRRQDQSQRAADGCANRRCPYTVDGVKLARQMLQNRTLSSQNGLAAARCQFGNDAGGALCSTPPSAAWVLGLAAAHCSKSATTQAARSVARRHQQRGALGATQGKYLYGTGHGFAIVARRVLAACARGQKISTLVSKSAIGGWPKWFITSPLPRVLFL